MKTRKRSLFIAQAAAIGPALAVAANIAATPAQAEQQKENGDRKTTPQASNMKQSRPNVVYIVLDDMGFADLGSFGSEVRTPNIDKLAQNGLRYNNSNVCPVSSPTRASLLTGRDNNSVGMGMVADVSLGDDRPNLQGRITPKAATVAEILKTQGYSTFGVGKWHVAPLYQITPAGPFENWPLGKGFERYYGFLPGEADQYHPQLISDNQMVDVPNKPGYHFSEDIVDHAIQFVTDKVSVFPEKPFFLYVAFGTAHSPNQVPKNYIDMYRGVYDKGWDQIRAERFGRQKQLGIVPANTQLAPGDPNVKAWDSLSPEQKKVYARFEETYAGYITHADQQVGRLIDHLKSLGQLDNTLIFLLSDNGGTGDGGPDGGLSFPASLNRAKIDVNELLGRIDELGGPELQAIYPRGWGQASNTPFQNYKYSTYAGGTRTPLVIHWPAGITDKGKIRTQYVHVTDITATVLDVLGIKAPEEYNGIKQMPMHGVSIAETFRQADAQARRTVQYYQLMNFHSIYSDGWKAIGIHQPGKPYEQDKWELYHVNEDYAEALDIAAQNPAKLKELRELFMVEAGKYGALPLKEIFLRDIGFVRPDSPAARSTLKYYRGMSHLGATASPSIADKDYTITVPVNRKNRSDEGVLVAFGDNIGGYTLYILDNRLVYEYNLFGTVQKITSNIEVPMGSSELKFEFKKTSQGVGTGALFINGQKVGELAQVRTTFLLTFEGLDVGRDTLLPVSKSYKDKGTFPFSGEFQSVTYELKQ